MRIVVCIDVPEGRTPREAYRAVKRMLDRACNPHVQSEVEGWESSDEWYGDDGEPLTEWEIQEARMAVFAEENGY